MNERHPSITERTFPCIELTTGVYWQEQEGVLAVDLLAAAAADPLLKPPALWTAWIIAEAAYDSLVEQGKRPRSIILALAGDLRLPNSPPSPSQEN